MKLIWIRAPSENESLAAEEEKPEVKGSEKTSIFSQMVKRIGGFFNINVSKSIESIRFFDKMTFLLDGFH